MTIFPLIFTGLTTCWTCAAPPAADREQADGFVPLFNGSDLAGWKRYDSPEGAWRVEEGMLVCTGKGGGWLGTTRDYADFVVRLEYRLAPGGNSGLYLRAPEMGHISRVGMEIQILDDEAPAYARLDYYQYCGALYHVVAPSRRASKPARQGNDHEVQAMGRQLTVTLNGIRIVHADLDRCRKDPEVAREHPGLARRTGRLGLQSHSERVEFRHLRIRPLMN